ncbi:MAG TPA: hemolysin III family protein [Gelria sp.]|nr:hemolysin III family protein [Gelria sp.]
MIWWARDPASAISHLVGFILAVIGTVVLVGKGNQVGGALYAGAFAVFGIAMVLLYLSSTLYHWLNLGEIGTLALRKLDHAMIYVMIAGTYTPLCIIALSGIWGNGLLIAIWALAVGGIFLTLFWLEAPRWLTTSIYILMGWLALVAIVPLIRVLPVDGFIWLLGGGIFYTIGGVIYGRKKSLINLPGFGFHEVFHIFVLAGSICHYLLMLLVLVKL